MADKKNPLLGAFHTPAPGTSPPGKPPEPLRPLAAPEKMPIISARGNVTGFLPTEDKKTGDPPKAPTAGSAKPEGEKKAGEQPKAPVAGPAKPEGEKKAGEPPKAPAAGPAKPEGEKKAGEPPKDPAAGPAKPEGEKKPEEPSKNPTAGPDKPEGEKKAGEPPKNPALDDVADLKMNIVPDDDDSSAITLPIDLIDDFEGHPFPVEDDQDMMDLVSSIKQFGLLERITVIPNAKKPGRFEIVAGHRRKRACQLAGYTNIRAEVRSMDRDTAIIFMVDSNLKREKISPMTKARAYAMKLEAMKRKAGRLSKTDILNGKKPMRADEQLAQQTGESRANIQKITRLTKLEPELQEMVEKKVLPVHTAADISYLKPEEQKKLADAIAKEGGTVPSGTQAAKLKKESQAGNLTEEKIVKTVAPTKREISPPLKVTLNDEDLRPYMPKNATIPDAKRIILEALAMRKQAMDRKALKNAADKDATKGAKEKKTLTTAR